MKIKYRDGGSKEFDQQQLHRHHKRTQQHSAKPKLLDPPIMPQFHGIFIPKQFKPVKLTAPIRRRKQPTTASPFTQGYEPAATTLFLRHFVGAGGTIWNDKLGHLVVLFNARK